MRTRSKQIGKVFLKGDIIKNTIIYPFNEDRLSITTFYESDGTKGSISIIIK